MSKREPAFENLLKVLRCEKPDRATLFEIIVEEQFYPVMAGHDPVDDTDLGRLRMKVDAMLNKGYDFTPFVFIDRLFGPTVRHGKETLSLNSTAWITDRGSYDRFQWPDFETADYSLLEKIRPYLPEGMKLMVLGPNGVMENAVELMGYDNMCMMIYDDPDLVQEIFDQIGSRLLRYYERVLEYDSVGLICSNDDWGFNTQPFISPADMRRFVFPWHKKIVEAAHRAGKPCVLHSCGNYTQVVDDIIDDIGFDGRHSYEDNIVPVEQAYEDLHGRIAVMGGIDMHFLTTATPEEIYRRSSAMLDRAEAYGGYALGSGNSIARYVPVENYFAMIKAATDRD